MEGVVSYMRRDLTVAGVRVPGQAKERKRTWKWKPRIARTLGSPP